MKKYALCGMILILPLIGQSQSFTLPSVIIDSLIFEVRKGRSCSALKDTLETRVLSLEDLNSAKDNRITGLVSQINDYRSLDSASTARFDNAQALYYIEKEKLKADKKKLWRVIIGEAAVIVLLAILL